MVASRTGRRRWLVAVPVVAAAAAGAIAATAAMSATSGPVTSDSTTATVPAGQASAVPSDGYGDRNDVFVLTENNQLYRFDGLGAGRRLSSVAVAGLAAGDRLVGIDTRPANGQLYGVGHLGRLYVIDPATGVAATVGQPFTTALVGDRFGVDFNPTVDRLRIVSDAGQNLRVDPTTGAVAGVDTALSYATGDTPKVTGAAYTNGVAGATSTALYDIDSGRDTLVLQGTKPGVTPIVSPNTGQLFPVGKLGLDVTGLDGFDIVGAAKSAMFSESDYTAVAAVRVKGSRKPVLARVDLRTGRASVRAKLPAGVVGLTASAGAPTTAYATTHSNELLRFDDRSLKVRSRQQITGLAMGETALGIDVRPANGQLYLLGSTSRLYVLNPATAVATPVGPQFTPALAGKRFGVDFNPTVDRLRVVSDTGQNLRINPDTAAVAGVDTALAYAADDRNGAAKAAVAYAAYTNNRVGATTTTLYDIDLALDVLAIQSPPNDGVLRTTGSLRVDADGKAGFDIAADGEALAALTRPGYRNTRIFRVDLATGQVRSVGTIRDATMTGLAIAPRGV